MVYSVTPRVVSYVKVYIFVSRGVLYVCIYV
jgi:hypothetical protein